jgi:hypothetical protein
MLENKQSIEQKSSQITENINEVRCKITDSSFRVFETCGVDDRNYEMRHYRGSMIRWQENGSVLLIARSADLTPNEGYLDVKSTGYMHFKSDHDIKLTAEGHTVTGGGEGGSSEEKSVDIFGTGDVVIQSNGKGGVYITAAKDIELNAGGSIKLKAAEQVSINTGSQDPVPFGLTESVGSGKLSISTGQYELSTTSFKETVSGSKMEENYGEVIRDQKLNILEPAALGPGAHITTEETVGTLHHKIGHDYILEVDGKMKVKVNNNPLKKVGPLFLEMPKEALKYEVMGSRTSTLNPDPILQYAQDFVNIPMGNSYCQVDTAMPGTTAWSAASLTKGDCVIQATAVGSIGIQTGPTPANMILLQNTGGSILVEANGAMGMIQMQATKVINATAAVAINLN